MGVPDCAASAQTRPIGGHATQPRRPEGRSSPIPPSLCGISRHRLPETFKASTSDGMLREDYFLDHTDYEYCARIMARMAG